MQDIDSESWLLLRAVEGIGDASLCRLVERFGSPAAVLRASAGALRDAGLSSDQADAVRRGPDARARQTVARDLKRLARGGLRLITCADTAYPVRLRAIHDPPPLLYVSGTLIDSDECAVAVVGSRKATVAGRLLTERFSAELAALGFTIVSGLARGVDASAHRGALAGGGRTLAVLGCGIDVTYPAEHKSLRGQIEQHGAVLSELPLGAPPHAYHFPRRNRIISGLSLGVLVTEAAPESGSLITARLAAEQGREVFAVPGAVGADHGRGTNGLIKQGAKLTETVEDIVQELMGQLPDAMQTRIRDRAVAPRASVPVDQTEGQVLEALSAEPLHVDEVIGRSRLATGAVSSVLLSLEIKGLVRQLPGRFFVRI